MSFKNNVLLPLAVVAGLGGTAKAATNSGPINPDTSKVYTVYTDTTQQKLEETFYLNETPQADTTTVQTEKSQDAIDGEGGGNNPGRLSVGLEVEQNYDDYSSLRPKTASALLRRRKMLNKTFMIDLEAGASYYNTIKDTYNRDEWRFSTYLGGSAGYNLYSDSHNTVRVVCGGKLHRILARDVDPGFGGIPVSEYNPYIPTPEFKGGGERTIKEGGEKVVTFRAEIGARPKMSGQSGPNPYAKARNEVTFSVGFDIPISGSGEKNTKRRFEQYE